MATHSLYIMLCSSERDKFQMAAMIATIAAVSERAVHLFVSMGAIKAFKKDLDPALRYTPSPFSAELTQKKAPDPVELLSQGKMLGDLSVYACSMVMDILNWDDADLTPDLFNGQMGLTKFLSDAENSQLITL